MRFLRKKGGDGSLWPWTAALARRSDMEEVMNVGGENIALLPVDEDPKKPATNAPDVYAITDKDQLRAIAKEAGVAFSGNVSLKTMQARLAEHFGIPPVTE